MFEIDVGNSVYQVEFCHLQINITSKCNMRCEHCRGDYSGSTHLSLEDFNSIMDFAKGHMQKGAPFLISGGEPLLHPNFLEIMAILKKRGVEFVSVTTNGSFVTPELLDYLDKLKFKNLRISVSLDSLYEKEHNAFRNNPTAYKGAIKAIDFISKHPNITCIVRTTIKKSQLDQVPDLIEFVHKKGANIFSISSVIPMGRAKGKKDLSFDAK